MVKSKLESCFGWLPGEAKIMIESSRRGASVTIKMMNGNICKKNGKKI
jgi:hypothetical protein